MEDTSTCSKRFHSWGIVHPPSSTVRKLAALSGTLSSNPWAAAMTSLSQRLNSATHSPIVDFGMLNCLATSLRLAAPTATPARPQ